MAKRIKTGSVIQLPLCNGDGFAYAKYINCLLINEDTSFPDMIKVFEYTSKETPNDINIFYNIPYIAQPLLLAGRIPAIKSGNWKVIGSIDTIDEDFVLPDMRVLESIVFDNYNVACDDRENTGFYVKNMQLRPMFQTLKKNVLHLELFEARPSELVEIYISLIFSIIKNYNINKLFNISDDIIKTEYKKALQAVLLRDISSSFYGKVIT